MQYDPSGDVRDWGPPNDIDLVGNGSISWRVPCWSIFEVDVYVQLAHRDVTIDHDDHDWDWYCTIWVASWELIYPTFSTYHSQCGLYHRACFQVEAVLWTHEEGWSYRDHV
jgi:hypothetical protein